MKKKYIALTMGIMMGVSLLGGCGQNTASTSSVSESEVVYGEVEKIEDDAIVIEVGTQKEREEMPEEESQTQEDTQEDTQEESEEQGNQPDLQSSMLDLTGEEKEIEVTDSTVIKRQSMGGGRGQGTGMGDAPEQPSENADGTEASDTTQQTPPEKPDGEQSDNAENTGEAPTGEAPTGEAPTGEAPSEEAEEITLEDISEGDIVAVTFNEDGSVAEITVMTMGMGGMGAGGGSVSAGVDSYEAVTEYAKDTEVEGETYTSTGTDENAILMSGEDAVVSLKDISISRTSSDSTGGDQASFYGVGAAALTTAGTSYISGSKIETDAAGAAGIFAYGDGVVYTSDTTISTTQNTSGGIHVAGGGTLYAWDMDVETDGESAAAIRSDRGGGKMVVDGGTYTSNGVGSPALYCTADIAVNNADLTANGSEAICIEGLNSLHLYNTNLVGNMSDDAQNDCTWNVILYQSMSGDSEVGNSTFEMSGGTLTAKNGGMFYTTNTESTITLNDVDITNASENDFFLKCTGNANQRGWGETGANGADCLFTAISQEAEGDVIWDSISMLDFYLTEGSSLQGAVTNDESCAGEGGDGYCNLYIEEGCTWTVTGDSVLSKLECEGTIVDTEGKTVTIKGSDGTTYVEGTGEYTITVDTYETTADTSGAAETTDWANYETEKPSELA